MRYRSDSTSQYLTSQDWVNLSRKSSSTRQYQVCFKGVNTLKSMLMHPKDKISSDQKKDLVYHWECKADGCNSSYIGETSRALGERVKEHSKSTTSAILKHCKDFHHPLPSIDDFNIIDKESSQITREAKEAIHIRRLDPSLNRNIGKMSIPHCFDNLQFSTPGDTVQRSLNRLKKVWRLISQFKLFDP